MKLSNRSHEPEWIDLGPGYYKHEEYEKCLFQLDRIGRFLGGDKATLRVLKEKSLNPESVLDVGCGGGFFSLKLASAFPTAQIVGIDTNPKAIEFANKNLNKHQSIKNVTFEIPKTAQLSYPLKQFDLITSTLVCHHLNDEELIDFLKRSCQIAKKAVIINDLHRCFLARAAFSLIAPVVFPSRLIFHDGLLSIKRAFKKKDWVTYLEKAGISPEKYSIRWHWAFRWTVYIDTSK